jgi:uridine kinase
MFSNFNGKASRPFVLGVCGGSGSGKTYFAESLKQALGHHRCAVVYQDNFYRDLSDRFDHDGGSVNYDHPDSIEFDLLARKVAELKQGQATHIPDYCFSTHKRLPSTLRVEPRPLVIVDGILILQEAALRAELDCSVFVDTPEAVRYARRLERDVKERGRQPEGVLAQFTKQVKPMHDAFVEPSKAHADIVIRETAEFDAALQSLVARFIAPHP